ncbi:hypothetical protein [Gimesia panareensis]|uniref:hypothetical protein n=1 Tax=Gimesia panareensis TaxID=2527978 RepID=UPI0011898FC4|nr:hypothetical protein [Gimesia panareensis]QDU50131.1 hypothetical protein Pan110_24730 [Gimesia panareensis]
MSLFQSRQSTLGVVLLVCGLCVGCGSGEEGPELGPVTGIVMMNEEPLVNADVFFLPIEGTPGVGGQGRTKEGGQFEIVYFRGGEGLPAGDYRVAVSYRLMPDGTPVPEGDDTPPIESPASESLPAKYSSKDHSEIKVKVKPGQPVELKLTGKKK